MKYFYAVDLSLREAAVAYVYSILGPAHPADACRT